MNRYAGSRDSKSNLSTVTSAELAQALTSIEICAQRLGPHALAVLVMVAERLARGAEEYGDDLNGRDWLQEGLEEAVDLAVYLARASLR